MAAQRNPRRSANRIEHARRIASSLGLKAAASYCRKHGISFETAVFVLLGKEI